MKVPVDMKKGTLFDMNNYGRLKVVNYYNKNKVKVLFCSTGFETFTRSCDIRNGTVKDLLLPSVQGVGYIGDGIYKATENKKITKAYSVWRGMLIRCYNYDALKRRPTYLDCYVCDEWHNFQNFAKWFYENYKEGFQIDKDIKVDGNKEYSPDKCIFVSVNDNSEKAHAKTYLFNSPNGDTVEIYNLASFCRENNLSKSGMCGVHKGNVKSHKGWTKYA